jgi:hypothetical protein
LGFGAIIRPELFDPSNKKTDDSATNNEQSGLGGKLLSGPANFELASFRQTDAESGETAMRHRIVAQRGPAPPRQHDLHHDARHSRAQHSSGDSASNHSHKTGAKKDSPSVTETKPPIKATPASMVGPIELLPSIKGFARAMSTYWHSISTAKGHHEYFTKFPPVYSGMDAPRPTPPPVQYAPDSIKSAGRMPSLNDLYGAAKDLNRIATHDRTKPDFKTLDLSEADFKKRYAEESVNVGKDYNMNKASMENLVKRVYAFEGGGWGTYYTLSSMPQAIMDESQKNARMRFHPSSSAIGYNQLLIKDTVSDITQHGSAIAQRLDQLATEQPARAQILHDKAQLVQELQDTLTHKKSPTAPIPADKHKRFFASSSEVEQAVQALNLDGDVGPVIQSQELNNLLKFARDNKFGAFLNTKTTLETSHAAEYDKLSPEKKAAAVDQILALVKSADVDTSKPETVATFVDTRESLRKKFLELKQRGSESAVERERLNNDEFKMMNSQILTIRRYGGDTGPLSPEARALLDRVTFDYFGGFSADQLQAAAIELANLAGMGTAQKMLVPENSNLPTSNFFAKDGYQSNPVTSRRSADELLLQIYRIMHGPNSDPSKPGMKQFNDAYNSIK